MEWSFLILPSNFEPRQILCVALSLSLSPSLPVFLPPIPPFSLCLCVCAHLIILLSYFCYLKTLWYIILNVAACISQEKEYFSQSPNAVIAWRQSSCPLHGHRKHFLIISVMPLMSISEHPLSHSRPCISPDPHTSSVSFKPECCPWLVCLAAPRPECRSTVIVLQEASPGLVWPLRHEQGSVLTSLPTRIACSASACLTPGFCQLLPRGRGAWPD